MSCLSTLYCLSMAESDFFNFPLIPGFSNKYLYRVNNEVDGYGLVRAIEIGRVRHKENSRTSFNLALQTESRHRSIGQEFKAVHPRFYDKEVFQLTDLADIQEEYNRFYGPKYNILVFDSTSLPNFFKKKTTEHELQPIFEGNPTAPCRILILKYELNGFTEYCGIRNVGLAFGVGDYCFNCKKTGRIDKHHVCM